MTCLRAALVCALLCGVPVFAQAQAATTPPPEHADPDARVDPLQPDFNLVALPTTLRMPVHKWAFRVTHRFSRPLGQGDLGDLASDLFGLDSAAHIGLELRYGLLPGTQVGIHRTNDRTIQIFGQHNLLAQKEGRPVGLDAMATVEGANNLREHHQGTVGLLVSRKTGRWAALYAEPIWVGNTSEGNSTLMIGFGGRVRVRPTMYLVGEITPRVAGDTPGAHQISFGLEGRAGGHLFQLNVSNGFGTTLGQLARGGFNHDDWFIGFNIARKFF